MADQPKPQLVESTPPSFRVRSVPHGDAAGIEAQLELGEGDGYELERSLAQANGDVLLFFRHSAPAPTDGVAG